MQKERVLLRADNFYLFAGVGPLKEGYIILAPHKCDRKRGGQRTISEASAELLDEVNFLKGIVTKFYRDVYHFEGGLFFEHGRAGTCGVGDKHCYHAHLCCFPVSEPIWKDIKIPGKRVLRLASLGELSATVGENPHILIHDCIINKTFSPETAGRESWETRVVVLDDESTIPRQYLRKLLAARMGNPDLWDWAAAQGLREVKSLCIKFQHWLQNKSQLPVQWRRKRAPRMAFLDGVRAVNSQAYDSIAHKFHAKWGEPAAPMVAVMNEFSEFANESRRQFGSETNQSEMQLLDAGCGPGIHLNVFRKAGFKCFGIDRSKEMLALAARELTQCKPPAARPGSSSENKTHST